MYQDSKSNPPLALCLTRLTVTSGHGADHYDHKRKVGRTSNLQPEDLFSTCSFSKSTALGEWLWVLVGHPGIVLRQSPVLTQPSRKATPPSE